MKALVVTPKNSNEFKFVTDLLKKLGVGLSTVTQEELEDIGMSKLMRQVDKTKKYLPEALANEVARKKKKLSK